MQMDYIWLALCALGIVGSLFLIKIGDILMISSYHIFNDDYRKNKRHKQGFCVFVVGNIGSLIATYKFALLLVNIL